MNRIPILNVYYLLCYAWRHVQERDTKRLASLADLSTVQDLLGKVLATGVNHLVRRGIDRGYVERREDLAGIRGKLAVSETAKRALRSRARAACEFEELSADILPNRILRTSLRRLLSPRITLDGAVRSEVRAAYRRLDGVSRLRLRRNAFGQVQLGGQRRVYHHLLSVCWLLYRNAVVDENTGHTAFRDFRRDKATMWRLFEDFVTGFYEREQLVYRVNPGGRRIAWADPYADDAANLARIPVMVADVILESPDRRIILDTKFYRDALARGRGSGAGKLHSNNLYQLLAYLRNRQANRPDGARHEGILLYPQVGEEPMRAKVRLEGFWIQARTVNLDRDWRVIHEEMLDTIGLCGDGRPT
ncbi:MAG: hypothetical protein OXU64_01390 [Gemmatimonadota bacterium]|nr:hypothetical protein [Gemmatimonadota bacterium]